jgi:hypothetical protein
MADSSRSFWGSVREVLSALFFGCVLVGAICLMYICFPFMDFLFIFVLLWLVARFMLKRSLIRKQTMFNGVLVAFGVFLVSFLIQIGASLYYYSRYETPSLLVQHFYPSANIDTTRGYYMFIERHGDVPLLLSTYYDIIILDNLLLFSGEKRIIVISQVNSPYLKYDKKTSCYGTSFYVENRIITNVFFYLWFYFDENKRLFGFFDYSFSCPQNRGGIIWSPRT